MKTLPHPGPPPSAGEGRVGGIFVTGLAAPAGLRSDLQELLREHFPGEVPLEETPGLFASLGPLLGRVD